MNRAPRWEEKTELLETNVNRGEACGKVRSARAQKGPTMIKILSVICMTSLMAMTLAACSDTGQSSIDTSDAGTWSVITPDASDIGSGLDGTTSTIQDVVTVDLVSAPDTTTSDAKDSGGPTQPDVTNEDAGTHEDVVLEPWVEPGGLGEHSVTSHSVTVSGQGSSFGAELYVPDSDAPVRAILLLPGFMLGASDFSKTSERLATHGFIVLCPSFGDSFFSAIDHAVLAGHASAMLDWLEDQAGLATGPVSGRLDASAFGMSGHSRGGKVALLTAVTDNRVKAIYTLDPVDTLGGPFDNTPTPENPSVTPELMGDLVIPAGFFGAGKGGQGFQPCAPEAENHEAYYSEANAAPVAYHHVDQGAGHMDFIDSGAAGVCAGGESSTETREAATKTLVAFMRAHLLNEGAYTAYLNGDSVDARLTWKSKSP